MDSFRTDCASSVQEFAKRTEGSKGGVARSSSDDRRPTVSNGLNFGAFETEESRTFPVPMLDPVAERVDNRGVFSGRQSRLCHRGPTFEAHRREPAAPKSIALATQQRAGSRPVQRRVGRPDHARDQTTDTSAPPAKSSVQFLCARFTAILLTFALPKLSDTLLHFVAVLDRDSSTRKKITNVEHGAEKSENVHSVVQRTRVQPRGPRRNDRTTWKTRRSGPRRLQPRVRRLVATDPRRSTPRIFGRDPARRARTSQTR
jgi:hypothetical protein